MATLQSLATGKVPAVFAKIQAKGLMLLCDIIQVDESEQGSDGGITPETTPAFENVPCLYTPKKGSRNVKDIEAGKSNPYVQYDVMLPRFFEDELLDVKAGYRIIVKANGEEPAKTFQVIGVQNFYGVYQMAICELPE